MISQALHGPAGQLSHHLIRKGLRVLEPVASQETIVRLHVGCEEQLEAGRISIGLKWPVLTTLRWGVLPEGSVSLPLLPSQSCNVNQAF